MIHSDTSSLFLHHFVFDILLVCEASRMQRYFMALYFILQVFNVSTWSSFQHATAYFMSVNIWFMWHTNNSNSSNHSCEGLFLVGGLLIVKSWKDLIPPLCLMVGHFHFLFQKKHYYAVVQFQRLKDKIWRTRDKRKTWASTVTSSTLSSHCNIPLFSVFIFQTRPLTSWLSSLSLSTSTPPAPSSDSSITSVRLPVGSSHCEMYERGEKWMANSIKSIIPGAALCYQQHCKGVLMHCLHAQTHHHLPPSPLLLQKSKLLWFGVETSFSKSSQSREALFQKGNTQQWAIYLHHKQSQQWEVRCQISTPSANKECIIWVCLD